MSEYNDLKITSYFYKLMRQKKNFMFIPSNDAVYIGEAWSRWNNRHGLTDPTPRYFFKFVKDRNGHTGYAIDGTEQSKTLMIPFELIELSA